MLKLMMRGILKSISTIFLASAPDSVLCQQLVRLFFFLLAEALQMNAEKGRVKERQEGTIRKDESKGLDRL